MATYVIRALSLVFAVLYTAFSMHACSRQDPNAQVMGPAGSVALEPKTQVVTILQSRDEISQYLQQATELYASVNGNTRFSVRTVANLSDYRAALRASLLSGESVDIFHVFGYQDMADLQSNLEELTALDWIHGAVPGTLDAISLGRSVYGVPYSISGIGLILNSHIFESAGIYVGDVVTLESLGELFQKLQEKIDSGDLPEEFSNLEAVTEFSAQDKSYLGSVFTNIVASGSFESPSKAARSSYIEMPESKNAEEFLKLMALYSSCTKWSQLNEVTRMRQVEDGIASGRVAVILDEVESYRRIIAINPEMQNRLKLLPVPLGTEKEPGKYVYTGAPLYWAINAASPDASKNEAKKFLTWLYRSDSGTALLANRFKAPSPYRDMAKDTGIPLHNQLLKQIEAGDSLPMLQNEFPPGWGDETLAAAVRAYLTHEITWDELTQSCKEDWHKYRTQE